MADGEGIFTRLGRMFNNGLAKAEQAGTKLMADHETKDAATSLQIAEHIKQKEQNHPLFSKGILAKWEQAGTKLWADYETRDAATSLQIAEHMKQKEHSHPLFSSVNPPENPLHGGEHTHDHPKAPLTPSVPRAMKFREI